MQDENRAPSPVGSDSGIDCSDLRFIFNQANAVLLELDYEGRVKEINRRGAQILGGTREEVIGKDWFETFILEEERVQVHDVFRSILEGKGVPENFRFFTNRVRTLSGEVIYVNWANEIMLDEDGSVRAIISSGLDVTQTVSLQSRMEKEKEKFARVFETSNDALMLLDSEQFFDANEATIRLFGYKSREEFLGKHPGEVSPPVQADGTPSKDAANERIATAFREGKNYFEWIHRRADGSDFYATVLLTPLELEGKMVLQATVRDITKEKLAEKGLKESEESYRLLFQKMLNGFALHRVITDDDGKPVDYEFLAVNPAFEKMTGVSKEKAIGKRVTDVIPGIEGEESSWIERYGKIALVGGDEVFEAYSSALDKWFSVHAYCPKPGYFATIFEDTTESRKSQEKLVALDRLKSRFISAIASATKAPLENIRWSLETLKSGDFGELSKEEEKMVEKALGSDKEIIEIIENMDLALDIEKGPLVLNRVPVSAVSMVRTAKSASAQGVNVSFTEKVESDDKMSVDVDMRLMGVALRSIFDNSVRYRKDKEGEVSVTMWREGENFCCSIEDNGIGVPDVEKPYVFDRFFRASNAQAKGSGVGLGLFIAKAVIEAHGGKIEFESTEGVGTKVLIRLPITSENHLS